MEKKAITANRSSAAAMTGALRRVAGSKMLPTPKPTWTSSSPPATEKAANAAKIPNARMAPRAASVTAATNTSPNPVGAMERTSRPDTIRAASASTSSARPEGGIETLFRTGVTARKAPSLIDSRKTAKAHPGSTSTTTRLQIGRDVGDQPGGEKQQLVQHPRPESHQRDHRRGDLRHEGERYFLNLCDDLEDADHHPNDEHQGKDRRADDQRVPEQLSHELESEIASHRIPPAPSDGPMRTRRRLLNIGGVY